MFHSARLKLTAWYLLIIISISLSFSFVIYRVLTREVERFSRRQRVMLERRWEMFNLNQPPPFTDPDLVKEIKQRILFQLGEINLVILVIAGGLGYFLAGQTLKPIAQMVEEQKRFVSDASHELRTPLTALKTNIEVNLRDKNLDLSQAKKILKQSIEEVDKLQLLTDNLLELAQTPITNKQNFFKTISLIKPVNYAIKKITPLANQKKLIIKKTLANCLIKGDENKLNQLFITLLDNAVKYNVENGWIEISTKKQNHQALVIIKDTGIGIDKKDLPCIFDRFYRADKARSKEGYGLGLSIAKKIVEDHQGTITVKSQLNKGSIFTISFPLFS